MCVCLHIKGIDDCTESCKHIIHLGTVQPSSTS